jgi:hypothetical protein
MRFPIRLLAFLLAHYLAALAISVSSRSDWVEVIVCSVPVGVFFAIIGFPYLALEVPWAVTLFVTLDRCTRPWMRLLVTIAAMFLFVWIGQAVAPPEGAFKGLRSQYGFAGAVFAATISLSAVSTRRRPGSSTATPPEPKTHGPPASP